VDLVVELPSGLSLLFRDFDISVGIMLGVKVGSTFTNLLDSVSRFN
jgi:hypothetical protein